jgi:cell division protein FtsB
MGAARDYNYNYYTKNNNRILKIAEENNKKNRLRERFAHNLLSFFIYFICFALIFSLAYLLIQRNSLIVKSKAESLQLDSEIKAKELCVENLESNISKNLDLTMIENKATTELNLIYPSLSQTIYIKKKWSYCIEEENKVINSVSRVDDGVFDEE